MLQDMSCEICVCPFNQVLDSILKKIIVAF